MSRTYAKSPEAKSERTTQQKPRRHYGRSLKFIWVVIKLQKIIFSDITFNKFFFQFSKSTEVEAACQIIGENSTLDDQKTAFSGTMNAPDDPRRDEREIRQDSA